MEAPCVKLEAPCVKLTPGVVTQKVGGMVSVVVMGVAGCGKSSVAQRVAQHTGIPLVEGDDFHSEANRQKMQQGVALTDSDRDGWLAALCAQLKAHPRGAVLTCSALKRSYRDRLRGAAPSLRFVFLEISPAEAQARVSGRGAAHFFSTTLVDNQFATLEVPTREPGVLTLDATRSLDALQKAISDWIPATSLP
jgi:gluconokinase